MRPGRVAAVLGGKQLGLAGPPGGRPLRLRLAVLPPDTRPQVAHRSRASRPAREIGQGSAESANGPDDIRDLAAPLCARGLPVHCLPVCCACPYARLGVQRSCSSAGAAARSPSPGWRWAVSARTASADAQWLYSTTEPTRRPSWRRCATIAAVQPPLLSAQHHGRGPGG